MTTPGEIRTRFLAAVDANDLPAILECYHDDAVLVAPEGRYEGRDYIEAYYRIQFTATPDGGLKVLESHDTGNTGIAEWTFSATHTGPLELPGGEVIPPTGRRVTQRGTDICEVRDGRIAEHRLYYDQLELVDQLGVNFAAQG